MGASERRKGRVGQSAFAAMLKSRDWTVADLSSGLACEDILATDTEGNLWAVEVKNTASILPGHIKQAMSQAKKRRARWMLANKLAGTSSWLIRRQGMKPSVWHEQCLCD